MEKEQAHQDDPFLIQRKITVDRYRQLNQHALRGQSLFAGSSLAEQFPINELLMTRQRDCCVYNRGVSGDVIDGLIKDLNPLVLDLAPSKLFINIGSNDIGSETYEEEVLYEKYIELLEAIQLALPKCQIHVLAYYPVNPNKNTSLREEERQALFANRTNGNIAAMNERLKGYSSQKGYTFIDLFTPLLDAEGNLRADYTIEGIHLWPAAYEVILDHLMDYL